MLAFTIFLNSCKKDNIGAGACEQKHYDDPYVYLCSNVTESSCYDMEYSDYGPEVYFHEDKTCNDLGYTVDYHDFGNANFYESPLGEDYPGEYGYYSDEEEEEGTTEWSEYYWKKNYEEVYLDLKGNYPLFCQSGTLLNDQATFSEVTWENSDNGYFSITTTQSTAWLHMQKSGDYLTVGPCDGVYSQTHSPATYTKSNEFPCDGNSIDYAQIVFIRSGGGFLYRMGLLHSNLTSVAASMVMVDGGSFKTETDEFTPGNYFLAYMFDNNQGWKKSLSDQYEFIAGHKYTYEAVRNSDGSYTYTIDHNGLIFP